VLELCLPSGIVKSALSRRSSEVLVPPLPVFESPTKCEALDNSQSTDRLARQAISKFQRFMRNATPTPRLCCSVPVLHPALMLGHPQRKSRDILV